MADDTTWKRRFYLYMGARLFGVATFLIGLAVALTDLLREGGWPVVGGILMLFGVIDAVFAPKLMKKQWQKEDGAE